MASYIAKFIIQTEAEVLIEDISESRARARALTLTNLGKNIPVDTFVPVNQKISMKSFKKSEQ